MQRNTALAAVVLAAFAMPAAADNFAGAYYGGNLGFAQSKTTTDQALFKPNVGNNAANHTATIAETNSLHPDPSSTDLTGGAQVGYNWRFGPAVLGGEVDFNYWGLDQSATASASHPVNNGNRTETTTNSAQARYIVTARPRVGFVIADKSMAYITGGIAGSDLKFTNSTTVAGGFTASAQGLFNASVKPQTGTVFGAGFEQAWSERVTWRIEWQRVLFKRQEFSTADQAGTSPTSPTATDMRGSSLSGGFKMKADFVRIGMNWKF